MKRRLFIGAVVGLVLLIVAYFAVGLVIYNGLSVTEPDCRGDYQGNTPTAFVTSDEFDLDTSPYVIPEYESVSLTSRGDDPLTLNAWHVEADPDTPTVILVHGLNGCKRQPAVLLAAGMLHRNGFNTLMIDLRDQGESEIEDGRYAGGTNEYLDVLGAWDWLVNERGVPPERIGVMGFSLGAATAMIAAGEEPQIAAIWEDSGFADIREAIRDELQRNGYPTFFAPSGLMMARIISGDDLTAFSPLEAVKKLDGRPIFITHGTADTRLKVDFAEDLAQAVRETGGEVEPWILPDVEHTDAIFEHTEEYEARLIEFFSTALAATE